MAFLCASYNNITELEVKMSTQHNIPIVLFMLTNILIKSIFIQVSIKYI